MSDYNLSQKIFVAVSILSTIIFFIFVVYFVQNVVSANGSVLGTQSSLLDVDSGSSKNLPINKIINIQNKSIISPEKGVTIVAHEASFLYSPGSLNLLKGSFFIQTNKPFEVLVDNDIIKILEPGSSYFTKNEGEIYVFDGILRSNSDIYAEEGQSLNLFIQRQPVSLFNLNELSEDIVFKEIIYTLYDNNILPDSLNELAPIPKFVRSF